MKYYIKIIWHGMSSRVQWFCLVWFVSFEFIVPSRIFHSNGDVIITGEGLRILTYARHSWPLSSDGSLACHTYCDTGHPLIMVISEDPWHLHLLPSVQQWSCHYLFLRLRSVAAWIRTPNPQTHCATAAVCLVWIVWSGEFPQIY